MAALPLVEQTRDESIGSLTELKMKASNASEPVPGSLTRSLYREMLVVG